MYLPTYPLSYANYSLACFGNRSISLGPGAFTPKNDTLVKDYYVAGAIYALLLRKGAFSPDFARFR